VVLEANDMAELTCQELVELVTDYLEGVLPERTRIRFERHIADCDGCKAYLDQMWTTIQLVGRLTESNLEPKAREELLKLFRDWKTSLNE
jgi:anti-sigma factor RsiW